MRQNERSGGLFARRALPGLLLCNGAHGFHDAMMVEAVRRTFGDNAAVLHDDDAIGGFEDLVQDMRDEDDGPARDNEAADMVEHLASKACIERRGRFVEDH
ncbi:hypothetical protein AJ87_40160 [Rhizobium yanglingense]|nr:hypothetical protein AJ87_40160 [Rhizobium yanglingense]